VRSSVRHDRPTSTPTTVSLVIADPHPHLLIIYFFYGYGDLRHLHSFPTRRSSDLAPLRKFFPSRPRSVACSSRTRARRSTFRPPTTPPSTDTRSAPPTFPRAARAN